MDNESTSRLKFDRRLANRRDWVQPEELEEELASLPDAADKMHVVSDEPQASASGGTPGSEGGAPGA